MRPRGRQAFGINCGSDLGLTSDDGISYSPDRLQLAGDTTAIDEFSRRHGHLYDPLLTSWASGAQIVYDLSVSPGRSYLVTLTFYEPYRSRHAKSRVVDVHIGDVLVASGLVLPVGTTRLRLSYAVTAVPDYTLAVAVTRAGHLPARLAALELWNLS